MKILYHDLRHQVYFVSCASPRDVQRGRRGLYVFQVCAVPDTEPCGVRLDEEAKALEEQYSKVAQMEKVVKDERRARGREEWREEID